MLRSIIIFLSLNQLFRSASHLLVKHNILELPVSPFSAEYQGIPKKYFADHQIADTVHSLVATKGTFSGLFFF